jgi:hypothetical protein
VAFGDRRSVTVRVRDEIDLPYHCDACGLGARALALVEGVGVVSAAHAHQAEDVARERAYEDARSKALTSVGESPCPRCGAPSKHTRARIQVWERRAASRRKARIVALVLGVALTILSTAGCLASFLTSPQGRESPESSVVFVCCFVANGVLWTGLAWAMLAPGVRPVAVVQPNVRFSAG